MYKLDEVTNESADSRIPSDLSPHAPAAAREAGFRTAKRWLGRAVLYLTLIILALIFLVPFVWMFFSSFKTVSEIFQHVYPLSWRTFIPEEFTLDAYRQLLELRPFPITRYVGNSLLVAGSVTLLSLAVNAPAAYAFARLEFPGRQVLFMLILSTMIVPFEVLIIPLFVEIQTLGWVNTFQALIIPWIANAFMIFLLRQFFQEIPRELEDAARIDGCSYFGSFWNVVIPNSIPALVTVALIRFQASWDSFVWPLVAAPAPEVRVIQLAIATFVTETEILWDLTFAASTIATVPVIILFLLLQRYYVAGIVRSGLKG